MANLVSLDSVELIPVVELEPFEFASETRPKPERSSREDPDGWDGYWRGALADVGLSGVSPLQKASWFAAAEEFAEPALLRRCLEAVFAGGGGLGALHSPEACTVLAGGLALRCRAEGVLVEPCSGARLDDQDGWKWACSLDSTDWEAPWSGEDWLFFRYEAPRLVLGEPSGDDEPVPRWSIEPAELARAYTAAEVVLERFALRLAIALGRLGFTGDCEAVGRVLAGASNA